MVHRILLAAAALLSSLTLSACPGDVPDDYDLADVGDPEPLVGIDERFAGPASTPLGANELARVCNATALNQRSGPATSNAIVKVLPGGSTTRILSASNGWYRHDWNGSVGWSSAAYLCAAVDGDGPGGGGGSAPGTGGGKGFASTEISRASFLSIGKASVGFSYWWGGGRLAAGASPGTCSGSCPSCTHGGSYGADCSGFIGKAWLLPAALPMDSNKHPYSTASFAGSSSLWKPVARGSLVAGDSLVYRSGGAGHIVMYEKNDPWGSFWAYEARGCSYGIVHNIRTAGSAYKGIRRAGV